MRTCVTLLHAIIGFGLLWWALLAEVKADVLDVFTPAVTVFSAVKLGMDLHERLTASQTGVTPAPVVVPTPAPKRAVVASWAPRETAMVVVPDRPIFREWFENSLVADDYPREKGEPEPLPLGQWKELMDDLAVPWYCGGRRPVECSIPQSTNRVRSVFFDVVYEDV